ncbi:Alpha-L-glutamate ligase family protein [gamma proteobacterium IMCC2047]|nr:Alpha-L-glutamate ligase family protein [gamma proteobacterium IMCC2047]
MMFATPKQLRARGIMGMNRRNVDYVAAHNPRHLYPLVDNKLKTKLLAEQAGIAVPKLLGTLRYQHDVKGLHSQLLPHEKFVIKPSKGSGGKGILVIAEREHDIYFKPSEEAISHEALERHVTNILSGLYSLSGSPDIAMIESMIEAHNIFDAYSFEGVPDIRVIIFKGYPVMAMLRLATHASDGKANLHQGAVGVGIDLATGKALHAVQHDRPIYQHPDTQRDFSELQIPDWDKLLPLAAACQEVTGLGYMGVDIVIDKNHGPLILELNARPGLAIQMANGTGIFPRLQQVEALSGEQRTPEQRAQISRELFGQQP